uniref:ATP synthase subunit a n=1 Tax=Strahlaxius plectrorhynchus TaxID=2302681 RepID=A0A4Y5QJT3_9EUCA|nr:ATP synthase F0 subunit 6 [Strahlaxius plectrorhynchus]QCX31782.1 ATP synthase F0 subunit 6 [Strahlaxius plectrorhynchus]
MMMSLFSIFEPTSSIFSLSLNWLSTFLGLLCLPYFYWSAPSRWSLLWWNIILTLHNEFKILLGPKSFNLTIMFITLFSLIVWNNFLGLLPYVFTSSSHLVMTLSLSLPMWTAFMICGWFNHTQNMFAHLVPQGTPGVLMPFMVVIETISNIIRPGTLAVRLAANMIAGHLLLTLLGNTGPFLSYLLVLMLIFSQILLLILESAVAIIQSYVFAVLSTLYASEIH